MKYLILILILLLTISNLYLDLKMTAVIYLNVSFQFAFWMVQVIAIIFSCLIYWILHNIFNNHKLKNTLCIGISSIYFGGMLLLIMNNFTQYQDNSYTISEKDYPIEKLPNFEKESAYIFLLPSCEHCINTAERLNELYQHSKVSRLTLVFYARKETAEKFVASHNLTVPFINLDNDDFFELSGSEYPSIIFFDTISIQVWTGKDVNYGAFDILMGY